MPARFPPLRHDQIDPGRQDRVSLGPRGRAGGQHRACAAQPVQRGGVRQAEMKADERGARVAQHVEHLARAREPRIDVAQGRGRRCAELGEQWREPVDPRGLDLGVAAGRAVAEQVHRERPRGQRAGARDLVCRLRRGHGSDRNRAEPARLADRRRQRGRRKPGHGRLDDGMFEGETGEVHARRLPCGGNGCQRGGER